MWKILRNIGWWFFCKIGDPIFSPSQAMLGDVVCLWCGKQHGKLTNESAWGFMLRGLEKTCRPSDIARLWDWEEEGTDTVTPASADD